MLNNFKRPRNIFLGLLLGVLLIVNSNAIAQPTLALGSQFISADPARSNSYMDTGGVWNGASEVSNSTGDTFVLQISNTAPGDVTELLIDNAYDISVLVDVPDGFRLADSDGVAPFIFNLTPVVSGGDSNCSVLASTTATQATIGGDITINLNDVDLPAQAAGMSPCSYTFALGITTTTTAPFVAEGNYNFNYQVAYAETDNGSTETPVTETQSIEVRAGAVAVLKTPSSSNAAGLGDTAAFNVAINGSGNGGVFAVGLEDIVSSNLNFGSITPPTTPAPPGGLLSGNQYSFNYLGPGERYDFAIATQVVNDPTALSCPAELRNEAQVLHRTISTPVTYIADYQFDLENPLLSYSPQDISVDVNGNSVITFDVTNVGAGPAINVSLLPDGLDPGFNITTDVNADWQWDGTRFNYVGISSGNNYLAAGETSTITFTAAVNFCPGPSSGTITWTPSYQNACGTDFSPPIETSNSNVTNLPSLSLSKGVTAPTLLVGQSGTYTISLAGSNLNALPTDGVDNNNEFSISDVLPVGLGDLSIPSIPVGTEVEVVGIGVFTDTGLSAANSIPMSTLTPAVNTQIIWRGDREDLVVPLPDLMINFVVTSPGCPVTPGNITVINSANLSYPGCSIADTDSASFIANQSPAGAAGLDFTVNGTEFETGIADTNGIQDVNEGDFIEFEVTYDFPDPDGGGAGVFPGEWDGTTFTADLGSTPLVTSLTLLNNINGFTSPMTVQIQPLSLGAPSLPETAITAVAANATGPITVDLDFLVNDLGLANAINDTRLIIRYAATADDDSLPATNFSFVETTALDIANGPLDCTGADSEFVQGVNVTLGRAALNVLASLNNGAPFDMCEIVPFTINLADVNTFTRSDNIDVQFDDSNYQVQSGPVLGGEFNGATIISTGSSPGNLTYTIDPITNDVLDQNNPEVVGDELSFNMQLQSLPGGLAPDLSVDVNYDTNQTSPRVSGENDKDYNDNQTLSPTIRTGELSATFLPPELVLADQLTYNWVAQVVNTGTGTAYGARFNTILPLEFSPQVTPTLAADCNGLSVTGPTIIGQSMQWEIGDLPPGGTCNIQVLGEITQQSCFQPQSDTNNQISAQAEWGCGVPVVTDYPVNSSSPPLPIDLAPNNLSITHDLNNSYCELCGEGEIRIVLNNLGALEISNIQVVEDLLATGLSYVADSTEIRIDNGSAQAISDSDLNSGAGPESGNTLVWNFADFANEFSSDFVSNGLSSTFNTAVNRNPQRVEIIFRVLSPGETFLTANKDVQATATFDLFCQISTGGSTGALSVTTTDTIPFNQPIPNITKYGRNLSAGQTAADYGDNPAGTTLEAGDVPGGSGDLVIWRLDVSNLGDDEIENLFIEDNINNIAGNDINFSLSYVCPNDADAEAKLLNNTVVNGCLATDTATSEQRDVDDPFGNPDNDQPSTFYDVPANGNGYIYLAGSISNRCTNNSNDASIAWGCEINGAAGSFDASTVGVDSNANDTDSALLSTEVNPSGVLISQTVTGITDTVVGNNGIVTITVENQSGGTVRNVVIADALPTGYVLDTTFNGYIDAAVITDTFVTPAFSIYNGMIDTVTVDATDLTNPTFTFSSSINTNTIPAQQDVLRHGDVLTFTFRIVRNTPFDLTANPEVRVESSANSTDPTYLAAVNNAASVTFENTCGLAYPANNADPANETYSPEDLDININSADPELFFLLNDPSPNLNFTVELSNNGGHTADDYSAYVIIGSGLSIVSAPPVTQCVVIPQGSLPNLSLPDVTALTSPTVYECSHTLNGALSPTQTITFPFEIGKKGSGADLTFRADVIGRVTTSDGNNFVPPTDGAPVPPAAPSTPGSSQTNDYSFDSIRARILGFTLVPSLLFCNEADTLDADLEMAIGEDCTTQLEAGWFGFATPGFGNIEIRDLQMRARKQGGQGYIGESVTSTFIGFVEADDVSTEQYNPITPPVLYDGRNVRWRISDGTVDGSQDGTITIEYINRNLNDALNASGGENNHNNDKIFIFDVFFEVFDTNLNAIILDFDLNNPGYPPLSNRSLSITVAEPNISISKTLCNETASGGSGPTCGSYSNSVTGDQDDIFSYRLEVSNATNRVSAFDITLRDMMDASDQVLISDLTSDGLDNDGDGQTDSLDSDGEGTILNAGASNGADEIEFTLDSLAPGATHTFYFRAQLAPTVVPSDVLTNNANVTYDSLLGATGSQTAGTEQGNGLAAGSRQYTLAAPVSADLVVTPLVINVGSKRYPNLSRRDDPDGAVVGAPAFCAAPCISQEVVIGDEVEVELEFQIPVATLNNFVLTDFLPDGLRCIEASDVTLPAGNFDATPPLNGPGTYSANACDADSVSWNFGNQRLLNGENDSDGDDTVYTFTANFIARVENVASNQQGVTLSNGGDDALPNDAPQGPTVVQVSYTNASGQTFTRVLGQADLTITEPQITLTKNMGALTGGTALPVIAQTAADANDQLWVEVVIENAIGAAPVHSDLRIYDDLTAVDGLTFNGALDPTITVDLSQGANQPIFSFENVTAFYPINAGETRRFAFSVDVANAVQPLTLFDNTVQATWQSLPDNSIALNSSGAIGTNGASDGARIGRFDFEPLLSVENDYQTNAFNNTISVPPPTVSKTDISAPNVINTIGGRREYQLQIDFPEGVNSSITIEDDLDSGSGNLVLENEALFPITYSCSDILTINGIAVNCTDSASIAAAITAPADEASGTVTWNMGNIVTAVEDDNASTLINPQLIMQYTARIADTPSNIAGNTVQNSGTANFINGDSNALQATAPSVTTAQTILEPDLIVNISGPLVINAGATGAFVMTALNPDAASSPASTVTSTAWDATFEIQLATGPDDPLNVGDMCAVSPLSLTAPTLVITDSLAVNRPLTLGLDYTQDFDATLCILRFTLTPNTAASTIDARLDAGDVLTINFEASVSNIASDAAVFTNVAGATEWFSLDTDGVTVPMGVRQYTRLLSDGTVGTDDHEDAVSVQAQSAILVLQKTLLSPIGEVVPGDTLTYEVNIVNEGAIGEDSFQLVDDLGALNTTPYFVNGSLVINAINDIDAPPLDDDIDNSNATGGTNNQGVVDISNLSIDPAVNPSIPTPSAPVTVEYSVTLAEVIPNGTQIRNQATAQALTIETAQSNIHVVTITSAPAFTVTKTVADLSNNPNITLQGETLRYTITVENTGNENAVNARLTDIIPAHTRYVPGSTTLNGVAIADSNNQSPIESGLLINSIDNTTSGFLTADSVLGNNTATISFDVVVDADVANGTVVSNQAVLTGQGEGGDIFEPVLSDNPDTPLVDDPTQTIIGGGVLLDVQKTVTLGIDNGAAGIVNIGDTLIYTFTIINNGTANATNVVLLDDIPANTSYLANTTTLATAAINASLPAPSNVPDPAINTSQLETAQGGISLGTFTAQQQAQVQFEVTVNGGSLITNQGVLRSDEQPDEPTDADGNDENGDQATEVVVDAVQELTISKEVQIIGGGIAAAGDQLRYQIVVENSGTLAATNVVISDAIPANTTFVSGSARMNGSATGVTVAAGTLTADYSTSYGNLEIGETVLISFAVEIANNAAIGTAIDNTATVNWSAGSASDSANIDVGATPGTATLSGYVWLDANHNNVQDDANEEPSQVGWLVETLYDNNVLASATTDANGFYSLTGFTPGLGYSIRFSYPTNNVDMGETVSPSGATTAQMQTTALHLPVGRVTANESLPLAPNGVAYNAISRENVAGLQLTLLNDAGNPIDASCFTDSDMQDQITGDNGFYAFNFNLAAPASCTDLPAPSGSRYTIQYSAVPNDYFLQTSLIIPPEITVLNLRAVPCNRDAIAATPECELQAQAVAPNFRIPAGLDTLYYLDVTIDSVSGGFAERLFANHLPVDPNLSGVLGITKTSSAKNVVRGELVPYEITLTETLGVTLSGLEIIDTMPPGFKYVAGSATVNGVPQEPELITRSNATNTDSDGRAQLIWNNISLDVGGQSSLRFLLTVGAGVGEGEYTNIANAALSVLGDNGLASNIASATVNVIPDTLFDCSDVYGKVYDDKNADGYQNQGEPGIANQRVVTANGLITTTDEFGRFHITCAAIPDEQRGGNFILKLDERSLPSGYRVTTENPRVVKLTRGKASKLNFGATIHRVVRIDLSDEAFDENAATLKPYWQPYLEKLYDELRKGPSILRLSYLGDIEPEALALARIALIRDAIENEWSRLGCCYNLAIETELFWRRGAPVKRPTLSNQNNASRQ